MVPLRLAYYKGVSGKYGALQFNLQKPHYFCPVGGKGDRSRKACPKDFDSTFPQSCRGTRDNPHDPVTMESREGCVFMEITSASGPNVYDWDKKIVLSLSTHDVEQVLFLLEGGKDEIKLMHDPGAKTETQGKTSKFVNFSSPKGIKEGCMVSATEKNVGSDSVTHTVPLNGPEAKGLSVFLRAVLPLTLAWV